MFVNCNFNRFIIHLFIDISLLSPSVSVEKGSQIVIGGITGSTRLWTTSISFKTTKLDAVIWEEEITGVKGTLKVSTIKMMIL